MDDFAGSADAIAEKLVAGGMDPQQAMMMALRLKQEPSGPLALRSTENMSVIGKSMTPPGLPESVVSDTVGIIKNMDDASVIATASRMTGLPFDSPIQARLMLEKMFAGGASILAGVSGVGSGLPQRMTGYEVEARFPALGGQVGVGAAIPRGQGSPAININYQRQFQEGGSVLASDTDKIAEQLIAGGVDPQQAMTMALRMAQSRQQADQSILGGVPTQPPVSDVPPATEILGGDPSRLFQRQPTTMDRIKDLPKDVLGAGEALVSMGSLAALAPASMLYALRPGQKTQGDPMEFALRNMYMPRSERGPSHLAGLGEVLESLPQTGPLPELQAFTGVGRGVGRQLAEKGRQAGRAMAPAAANVAEDILRRQGLLMDVVKPKGGNFIGGDVPENIDRQLAYLKTPLLAGESPAQRIPRHEQLLKDPKLTEESRQTVQRHLEQERKFAALDNWIERNLSNYVKREMGTAEDPVRKLAESGVTHIQERYNEPGLTTVIKRKEAGFPEQGIGQSPEARSWENLSDRSIDDYLAGTIQPQAGYVKDFERLNEELSDFGRQIRERFFNERTERLVRLGETRENAKQIINDLIANKSNGELAKELNNPDLLKQYSTLRARTNYARSLLDEEYANILRQNPWVEKLDPNTRLYTARTENLQFDHIVDVLRDDLDSGRIRPEQLNKVSVADAVRRTYEFDQEMAKKAEQAQAELANKLLNESPFKVYDNGYKWVKLPDPASSDEAMKLVQDIGCQGGWCTQKETNALYYGAHGEGNSLFVLMSPDKRVHAQIHVQSPEKPYDFDALMSDPQTKAQAAQAVREWRQRNPNVETPLADDQIYQALREAGIPEQSPAISEIKPRANSWTSQMVADQVAKDPEYKKTIQGMLADFVKTAKYPVEYDLGNTGLFKVTAGQKLPGFSKEIPPGYYSLDDFRQMAIQNEMPQEILETWMQKLAESINRGFAAGGAVIKNIISTPEKKQSVTPTGHVKAVASARRALEKAMAKGGQVKMAGGGSVIGKAAAAAAKQAKAVLSPAESQANLQKMLAESQVKDRLYHGASADIDRFKSKSGEPVFLSPDPNFASKFALDDMLYGASSSDSGPVKSGANVMPVYAQVKNPFDYENPRHIRSVMSRLDHRDKKAFKESAVKGSWQEIEKHLGSIEDSGFDSVFVSEMGRKNLAVFDPKKIKSAIGNQGTYDITSPELNKAHGGEVKMGTGGSMLGTVAGKAAAAGKKSTQWAQEAAAAKRAPAKSKEEIEAIARRMAAQTQPGFVRASEEQSINPAGKSQLLYEMEQRTPMVVESTIADRPVPNVDYEQQLGKVIVGVPGDPTMGQVAVPGSLDAPTRGGKQLVQVGDVRPETPVQLYGGPRYGANLDETFWASNLSPARAVQNLVQEMAQKYGAEQVLGKYIKMSPESSRFAMHNLDALISVLQPEKLDKDKVELLNNLVRKGNPKHKFPEFAGFEDPINVLLQAQMNSKLRKQISEVLEKPSVAKQVGFPFPGKVVQTAITEPELRNVETGVTGFAMGKMNPEGKLSFSSHPTYDYDIPGQAIGRSKYLIPSEMSFPDFTAWYRSRPDVQAKVDPINMMKSYGPRQVIDQQYIDEIKMYEEAMKRLTGKKKGGLMKKSSKLPKVIKSGKVGGLSALRK